MPPTWIRRPLSITAWLLLSAICLLAAPLLLAAAALAAAVMREPKPLILVRVVLAYFRRELVTLLACGGLWLLSGAGRLLGTRGIQTLHWQLLRWFVDGIASSVLAALEVQVASDSAPAVTEALADDHPVIIFSRHAGPADTVLLVHSLMVRFARRPSVVFKEALALDPCVDLLAHRLPHAVLDTDDRVECEKRIARASAAMGVRGVLLLFPEGGNFTRERRRHALRSLRRKGRAKAAAAAQEMSHVLPPKPSGAHAALRANPSAAVIFAAHTGLGLAAYPRELWRDMPIGRTLQTRMWLVPRPEVPADPQEQTTWLNEWWKRIDDWIEQQQSES